MNILITGANGQLGREMQIVAADASDAYFFTDVDQLDITNEPAIEAYIKSHSIDIIVNCAAYTNVEKAEDEPQAAALINAQAPLFLSRALKKSNGLLIHISTDYVFSPAEPRTAPFTETDPVCPASVYGRTKAEGEQNIMDSGCRHIILRTAWLYSPFGSNFLKTILRLSSEKEQISVVSDQIGSPTSARDLAKAIYHIISSRLFHEGLYHFTNEGQISWWDFAVQIALQAGHTSCEIRPCSTAEYPTKAVRPAFSLLSKEKFAATFHLKPRDWKEALNECIHRL